MTTPGDRSRAYYQGASGEAYHSAVHGREIDSRPAFEAKARLAHHRYFRDLAPSSRVFEFGVGTGVNLAHVEAAEKAGFDISEAAAALSRTSGIDVFTDMADVPSHHYDVVVCRHVLEHVPDPSSTLITMASKMNDRGKLLLVLPVETRPRHLRRLPAVDVNQHLFSWKLNHISNLLEVCGLEVESFAYEWYSMQRILRWVPGAFGVNVYSRLVSLAGWVRRQSEMVVWARPSADQNP